MNRLEVLQVAIFVAVGGGMLGHMYAEQPADAYIDMRVGKRPYGKQDTEKIRKELCAVARKLELNPHDLPLMPRLNNCGVW